MKKNNIVFKFKNFVLFFVLTFVVTIILDCYFINNLYCKEKVNNKKRTNKKIVNENNNNKNLKQDDLKDDKIDISNFDLNTIEITDEDILKRVDEFEEYQTTPSFKKDKEFSIDLTTSRDKIKNLINAKSVKEEKISNIKVKNIKSKSLEEDDQIIISKESSYSDLIDIGIQKIITGEFKKSIEYFKKAIQIDENGIEAYYNIGCAYFYCNNIPNAIINFKRAIDIKPNFAEAYNNLGVCYVKIKLLESSLEFFKKALIYAPTLLEPQHNLDALKNKDLKYNFTSKLFTENTNVISSSNSRIFSLKLKFCPPILSVVNIDNDPNRIQYLKSQALNEINDYKQKLLSSYPDINVKFNPDIELKNEYSKYWDALNLLNVADELYDNKLYKEAEKFYDFVIKMVPNAYSVYFKRALTRLKLKNERGAEADLKLVIKYSDNNKLIEEALKLITDIRSKKFELN